MRARWIATMVAAFALLAGVMTGVSAQDMATPTAGNEAHPAHIHNGTCENLGDVVYPLNDVTGSILSGTPAATPAAPENAASGSVIGSSQTEVDASLDDLVSGEYAINVHKSAQEMDVYIACGNVKGEVKDGTLYVDLQQQNDSGVAGQAILDDIGNGKTEVTITLTDATVPEATPSS